MEDKSHAYADTLAPDSTAAPEMISSSGAAAARIPSSVPDLVMMDAPALSQAIRVKKVSCREVMQTYLDHIERFNPKVNAIISLQPRDLLLKQAGERDAELARGHYRGWLHGFPHAVKDLTPTRGIRTTLGSRVVDLIPEEDAIFVDRLRQKGAIIIGKTNTSEFGLGSQTYNVVFGTTLNAYDPTKTAGGSSGGAASALALRMLPLADGTDMMGSLRNPAAYNNVIGFRTSHGRVPSAGIELFLGQLSVAGPMGRRVEDVAMLLSVMAGPDARAPLSNQQDPAMFAQRLQRAFKGTRVGWLGDLGGHLPTEPGVLEICRGSFKTLESLGCTVEDARLDFPPECLWQTWLTLRHWLVGGELMKFYSNASDREKLKPEAIWEIESGLKATAQDVYEASVARSDFYRALAKIFTTYEYLLLPSAQVFPFDATQHWPKSVNGVPMDTYHRWMEVVVPASLAGLPAISVPVGFGRDHLPMGMQIIGRHAQDFAVLQLAHAYEQETQWVVKHLPPLLKA
jgi:amidase